MKPKMASSAQSSQKLIRVSVVEDDNRCATVWVVSSIVRRDFQCVSKHPSAEDALRDLPPHHPNHGVDGHQPGWHERRGVRCGCRNSATFR